MKKSFIITLTALAALVMSCQKGNVNEAPASDLAEVTFAIELPVAPATKTIGDGTTATELYYAAFNQNGEYIKRIPRDEFVEEVKKRAVGLEDPGALGHDDAWWDALASQFQVRTKFLGDIPSMARCFVTDDYPFDEKAVEKRLKKPGVKDLLLDLAARFEAVGEWKAPALEAVVKELSQGGGMGPWVHPVRVAVSGRGEGIGLFEMLELLGRETTLVRIRRVAGNL